MQLVGLQGSVVSFRGYSAKTGALLALLAFEFGRSITTPSFETVLLSATTMMVIIMPYFISTDSKLPAFGTWVAVRLGVTVLLAGLGTRFDVVLISAQMEAARQLPFTMLIVVSMISTFSMFYGLIRLRLAK
jgi:hypothetical protein